MFAFSSWFFPRRNPRQTARRLRCRPRLEPLEDRAVPAVSYFGGDLLTHVEAQAVYLGSAWNSSANAGTTGTLDNYLNFLVNSPYTEALTRAGYGVGSGTATAGVVDPVAIPSGSIIRDRGLRAELQSLISQGAVAAPDANRLYVVFVQPNALISEGGLTSRQGLLGYHGAFAGHTATGQAVDVHYAVIAYPGGSVGNPSVATGAIDNLTAVASHEVAEAITDPNVNYKQLGWYDPRLGEIGDITQGSLTRLNGFLVQEVAGRNDQPLSLTSFAGLPATTTSLRTSTSQVSVGGTVTIDIQVASPSATGDLSGVVTLLDGDQVIGTVRVGSNGVAHVTLFAGAGTQGSHTLTAVYSGNGSFLDSFSSSIVLTVG